MGRDEVDLGGMGDEYDQTTLHEIHKALIKVLHQKDPTKSISF